MYQLYRIELKKSVSRIEFKFIFVILLALSVGAHLVNSFQFYDVTFDYLRPAKDMTLVVGNYVSFFFSTLVVLTPVLSSFIYSDNYVVDRIRGTFSLLLTRAKYSHLLWAKAMAVITVSFTSFFLVLMLNLLFTYITFPQAGGDDMYALPAYDIGLQRFDSNFAFDLLSLNSPLAYAVFYSFLLSLFASSSALFTFALTTVVSINRYFTIIGTFVFLIILNIFLSFIGFFPWGWSSVFSPNSLAGEWAPFVWIICITVSSFFIIFASTKKGEVIG